jgi:hypothetical protein
MPSGPTGSTVRSTPRPASHSQVSSTAACSVATVTIRLRLGEAFSTVPLSAQLIASVALPVNATLPRPRPMARSTWRRATSTAASASCPHFDGECGLANFSSIHGCIALATSGATGVVAW